jgi:hypothetical protein
MWWCTSDFPEGGSDQEERPYPSIFRFGAMSLHQATEDSQAKRER